MPFTRWIISSNDSATAPSKNAIVNTIYLNVATVDPTNPIDWTTLGNDLYTLWVAKSWMRGRFLDIRGYDMGNPEPRPQRYRKTGTGPNSATWGPHQVAIGLSYYADRNLPRQRGRIFLGPWLTNNENATDAQTTEVIGLATGLANLGGANVDWSLWSPTTQTHTRISNAWVDDSWDIIRSRKTPSVAPRKSVTING